MAQRFNIVAELQLQGPRGIRPVVSQLQRQLSTIQANVDFRLPRGATRSITNLNRRLDSLNSVLIEVRTNAQAAGQALGNLGTSSSALSTATNNTAKNVKNTNDAVRNTKNNADEAANSLQNFGRQSRLAVQRFAAFSLAAGAMVSVVSAIRNATSEALDFQREVVRLGQVTQRSTESLQGLVLTIGTLSTSLGVSSRELVSISRILVQAGLSIEQTQIALDTLAKTELAPTFDNITQTAEGAIAILRQFRLEAGDLEAALGAINSVAGNFAVESGDLITAVRRAGGAFQAAGGELNELLALFTSVRSTTRESADSIATGFRTIFTRVQRNETAEELERLGISLRDLDNQFVGPFEAVRRLNEALSQIPSTDPRFSSIVEELGGFRQVSRVIPLIQQFASAQEALAVAQGGATSLTRDAQRAQESFLVRLTAVQERFLEFTRSLGENEAIQALGNTLLFLANSSVTLLDAIEPLIPAIGALATIQVARGFTQFASGFLELSNGARGAGEAVGAALGGADTPTQQRRNAVQSENTSALTGLTTALGNTNLALANLVSAVNANTNAIRITSPTGFAAGGLVPGSGNRDTFPARLMPGEFVIKKSAVQSIGIDNLNNLNRGGYVQRSPFSPLARAYADGGTILPLLDDEIDRALGSKDARVIRAAIQEKFPGVTQNTAGKVANALSRKQSFDRQSLATELSKNQSFLTQAAAVLNQSGEQEEGGLSLRDPDKVNLLVNTSAGRIGGLVPSGNLPQVDTTAKSILSESRRGAVTQRILQEAVGNDVSLDNVRVVANDIGSFTPRLGNLNFSDVLDELFQSSIISASANLVRGIVNRTPGPTRAKARVQGAELENRIASEIDNSARGSILGQIFESVSRNVIGGAASEEGATFDFEPRNRDAAADFGLLGINNDAIRQFSFIDAKANADSRKSISIAEKGIRALGVRRLAQGGAISDTVPALLTPGEFVINRSSAQRLGRTRLEQLNQGVIPGFNKGGAVGHIPRFQDGGEVELIETNLAALISTLDRFGRATEGIIAEFSQKARQQLAQFGATGQQVGDFLRTISDQARIEVTKQGGQVGIADNPLIAFRGVNDAGRNLPTQETREEFQGLGPGPAAVARRGAERAAAFAAGGTSGTQALEQFLAAQQQAAEGTIQASNDLTISLGRIVTELDAAATRIRQNTISRTASSGTRIVRRASGGPIQRFQTGGFVQRAGNIANSAFESSIQGLANALDRTAGPVLQSFGNRVEGVIAKIRGNSNAITRNTAAQNKSTDTEKSAEASNADFQRRLFATIAVLGTITTAFEQLRGSVFGTIEDVRGSGGVGQLTESQNTAAIGVGVGGALSGATAGAVAGQVLGPQGAIIGGVIGGLVNFTTSLNTAREELLRSNFAAELETFSNTLRDVNSEAAGLSIDTFSRVNSGLDAIATESQRVAPTFNAIGQSNGIADFNNLLDNSRVVLGSFLDQLDQAAGVNLIGNLVGGREQGTFEQGARNTISREQIAERREFLNTLRPQLGELRKFGAELAKNADTLDEFERAGGGAGGRIIDLIADIENLPISEVERQFQDLISASVEASRIEQAFNNARRRLLEQTALFGRLNDAVTSATLGMQDLTQSINISANLVQGQLGEFQFQGLSDRLQLGGGPNIGAFNNAVDTVISVFASESAAVAEQASRAFAQAGGEFERLPAQFRGGGFAQNFGRTLRDIDTATRSLPEILTAAVSDVGPLTEGNLRSRITDSLRDLNLGPLVTDLLVSSVEGLGSDTEIITAVSENLGDTVSKITSNLEPFADIAGEVANQLENNANQLVASLRQNTQLVAAVAQAQDRILDLELERARFQAGQVANRLGGTAESRIDLDALRRPFEQRQQRLTGLGAADSLDANSIADALGNTLREVEVQRQRTQTAFAETGGRGDAFFEAASSLEELQSQAVNLRSALENLTNVSDRNAAVQERLTQLQREQDTRRNFGERFVRGSNQERRELALGFSELRRAVALLDAGTLDLATIPQDVANRILDTAGALGETQLDVFGGRTGNQLRNELIDSSVRFAPGSRTGGFGQPEDQRTEQERLVQEQADNINTAIRAQERLAGFIQNEQSRFFSSLQSIQGQFFTNLDNSINTLLTGQLQQEVSRVSGEANTASERVQLARQFADVTSGGDDIGQELRALQQILPELNNVRSSNESIAQGRETQSLLRQTLAQINAGGDISTLLSEAGLGELVGAQGIFERAADRNQGRAQFGPLLQNFLERQISSTTGLNRDRSRAEVQNIRNRVERGIGIGQLQSGRDILLQIVSELESVVNRSVSESQRTNADTLTRLAERASGQGATGLTEERLRSIAGSADSFSTVRKAVTEFGDDVNSAGSLPLGSFGRAVTETTTELNRLKTSLQELRGSSTPEVVTPPRVDEFTSSPTDPEFSRETEASGSFSNAILRSEPSSSDPELGSDIQNAIATSTQAVASNANELKRFQESFGSSIESINVSNESLQSSIALFSQSADFLGNAMSEFAGASNALAEAMNNFPRELTLTGNQRTEVIVNGAAVLQSIIPVVRDVVNEAIREELQSMFGSERAGFSSAG